MTKLSSNDIKVLLDLKGIPNFVRADDSNFKVGSWKRIKKYKTSNGVRRFFTKQYTPFIAYVDELNNGNVDIVIRVANPHESYMVGNVLAGDYYEEGIFGYEIDSNEHTCDLSEGLLAEEFEFGLATPDDIYPSIFVSSIHSSQYDQYISYIAPLFGSLFHAEISECYIELKKSAGVKPDKLINTLTKLGFKYNSELDHLDDYTDVADIEYNYGVNNGPVEDDWVYRNITLRNRDDDFKKMMDVLKPKNILDFTPTSAKIK